VRHTWQLAEREDEPCLLDVAVTFEDDATTHAERLPFWPFTHHDLQRDLLAAGFEPATSTFTGDVERYLVTSRANSSNASR